jgi:hypothetical protein
MEVEQASDDGIEGGPHMSDDPTLAELRAWEEVDVGRYMPRRIKGSYKGRALG